MKKSTGKNLMYTLLMFPQLELDTLEYHEPNEKELSFHSSSYIYVCKNIKEFENILLLLIDNTLKYINSIASNFEKSKNKKKIIKKIIKYVSIDFKSIYFELEFDTKNVKKLFFFNQELISNFDLIVYTNYIYTTINNDFPRKVISLKF